MSPPSPLLLLSLSLSLSASFASWLDGDAGIDHMYSDLSSGNMTTNTTAECAERCMATANCLGWVVTPSGSCGAVPYCYLKSQMTLTQVANPCRISGFVNTTLLPPAFLTTPVGAVVPAGWIKDQLTVQAQGLTGYLAHFWADIENSSWIGGPADGGLHERTPYWLNGLVPLSHLLPDDTNLNALRDTYLTKIMESQAPSGWLGPDDAPSDGNQYWGRFNVILSLIQHYEASQDARAITTIFNYLAEARRRMQTVQLDGWASVRAQDFIMALFWLVDNFDTLQGVPPGFSQAFLLDLADLTHNQMLANGADWKTYYDDDRGGFPLGPACVPNAPCNMLTHGVNIGQAIKSEAVWYRRSTDETDVDSTYIRIKKLDTYHSAVTGMFQADEHLAGSMPSHGTETCAVVEAIVSYAVSGAIIGDPALFERAEKIVYNAMPAALTKDFWARVYLQQSEEIEAVEEDPHIFFTDGGASAIFSLEGNYGCCTANAHAGWPKFVQRAVGWDASTGTVGVFMWAPLTATTPFATVSVATLYPFGDTATVTVTPTAGASAPVPVLLRIPSWADAATLSINGAAPVTLTGSNGTFYPSATASASGPTTFTLNFNPSIRLQPFYNGTVVVTRGALVYALWIGQNISVTAHNAFSSNDYAITATSPWQVALVVDRANPAAGLTFNPVSAPTNVPWNSTAIPMTITGTGRVVNGWGTESNAAAAPPASPACAAAGACGDAFPVTLVPFGSTHIRMGALPTA